MIGPGRFGVKCTAQLAAIEFVFLSVQVVWSNVPIAAEAMRTLPVGGDVWAGPAFFTVALQAIFTCVRTGLGVQTNLVPVGLTATVADPVLFVCTLEPP